MSSDIQSVRFAASRRRSSGLRSSTANQPCAPPRRRSSAIRRNIETFNRNRAHNARRRSSAVAPPPPRRMRTRSMAREEMEAELAGVDTEIAGSGTGGEQPTAPREWRPSVVVGAPLWLGHEDPSRVEIADRKVAQTALWAHYYKPSSAFAEMHQRAVQARNELDEKDETNTKPRSELTSIQTDLINQRLDALRSFISDSEFAPEKTNMEAAIAGYESGDIPYSNTHYTLIWAGKIVDRHESFESFTQNRSALLDRYATDHGPGWLWYEPPLSAEPSVTAKKNICLVNKPFWRSRHDNMGHFRLPIGFRRRKDLVSRPPAPPSISSSTTTTNPWATRRRSSLHHPKQNTSVKTAIDPDGPTVIWETLLDSGATLPCIYEADLPLLNIPKTNYAATTVKTVSTASGIIHSRVYDMNATIVCPPPSSSSSSSTLPPNLSPTSPRHPREKTHPTISPPPLHAPVIPVIAFRGSSETDFRGDDAIPDRLSGFFPFAFCYLTSAPANHTLWLGSTRAEVLGATRMPGHSFLDPKVDVIEGQGPPPSVSPNQRKIEEIDNTYPPFDLLPDSKRAHSYLSDLHNKIGNPTRIRFEHDFLDNTGRVLVDENNPHPNGSDVSWGPRYTDFSVGAANLVIGSGVRSVHIAEKGKATERRTRWGAAVAASGIPFLSSSSAGKKAVVVPPPADRNLAEVSDLMEKDDES
ncbi:hypothetical protein QBC35DRAFT_527508 [Podospora australis]|uniref:Uncharacterized protein n=1 Tax=Podospora australis TaxID=1536484 RepID=A0AAN7AQ18_9PEZI|nr:hypothetical protein QBC35DRAFT_527508 [Podospora australis]